ncbi:phosphoenolpyruvate--protein phosphotransferase [Komagataeibacter medellinensis]|uniref:Phosphoenolpyruvate-protein phosphotransferase n=1 Tax=Komagataeibacter medellinensis (strain NBRC 3288 / BCRC 11682 / LMG 1693 / Kondo 51) TaxID=634177 RepID=G2HZT9_KOMMN|nr:phosphoenolpyruvate--protein phosphotransferase [Komagataeibacter medellinensis]BAK84197.1 phosphoenolpyruvate-protein phosphotransferase [Komagataeibacter medellinensis NBRC 3288]
MKATERRPSRSGEVRLAGQPVSPGVAIGHATVAHEPAPPLVDTARCDCDPAHERTRLHEAISRSAAQLRRLHERLALLPEDGQVEIGSLLEVYRRMLGPSRLRRGIEVRLVQGMLAEAAVLQETEALAAIMLSPPGRPAPEGEDAVAARRRAGEFREIGRRLIRNLSGTPYRSFSTLPDGAILVAEQLRPADAALIDPSRIAAVVTEEGGSTGHTAILLRALGIPAVLAAHGVLAQMGRRTRLVVDGMTGRVIIRPSTRTAAAARVEVAAYARERQMLGRLRRLPARLSSGEVVTLQANLEIPAELPMIAQSGAAGIGLLRSEFLFMNAQALPDEDQQEAVYRPLIEAMAGDPVTIRVVDWGSEKNSDVLSHMGIGDAGEINPALGIRGIRLLLQHRGLLETQFAAILRAATAGPVRVLLPMVSSMGEMRAARDLYARIGRRLRRRGVSVPDPLPPLGIMVETPAAALMADVLAQDAEFLAIGTNDLTMYTLAADRAAHDVAALYDPLHPAVLRLVRMAADAGLRQRRPVSLCGEMASDPRCVPLLVGLGIRAFSMHASAVPRVKQAIRAVGMDDCRRMAARALEAADGQEVTAMLAAYAEDLRQGEDG